VDASHIGNRPTTRLLINEATRGSTGCSTKTLLCIFPLSFSLRAPPFQHNPSEARVRCNGESIPLRTFIDDRPEFPLSAATSSTVDP